MFGIFKKNKPSSSTLPVNADIHSHILPGIDDGSPDLATSILLVKGLKSLGINSSCATPHVIGDMFRNTPETIGAALRSLQDEIKNQDIDFELTAAAEYMLDSYFLNLLKDKKNILTIRDNLILTEFSYASMPDSPGEMSFAIITEGFSPILAHPERYAYYHNDYNNYHRLQELGFILQVNLLSLTGYYGKEVSKAAHYIVKEGLVSFTGTDLHHDRHLAALNHPRNLGIFSEAFENAILEN